MGLWLTPSSSHASQTTTRTGKIIHIDIGVQMPMKGSKVSQLNRMHSWKVPTDSEEHAKSPGFTQALSAACVTHQLPKKAAREPDHICMNFTSFSLAGNILCCSMDSSFLIHCSNYILQPEYGSYVKTDGRILLNGSSFGEKNKIIIKHSLFRYSHFWVGKFQSVKMSVFWYQDILPQIKSS